MPNAVHHRNSSSFERDQSQTLFLNASNKYSSRSRDRDRSRVVASTALAAASRAQMVTNKRRGNAGSWLCQTFLKLPLFTYRNLHSIQFPYFNHFIVFPLIAQFQCQYCCSYHCSYSRSCYSFPFFVCI